MNDFAAHSSLAEDAFDLRMLDRFMTSVHFVVALAAMAAADERAALVNHKRATKRLKK